VSALPDDPFLTGAEDGWETAIATGRLLGRALFDLADDERVLVAALGAMDDHDLRDVLLALMTEIVYIDADEEGEGS
jgi:hypothetical protein